MKIICKIKDDVWLDYGRDYYPLALDVSLREGVKVYIQAGEYHEPIWVNLSGFEVVDQTIPSCWVDKKYTPEIEGQLRLMPANWIHAGFFEDLNDEVKSAVDLFNYEISKIYTELKAPGYDGTQDQDK